MQASKARNQQEQSRQAYCSKLLLRNCCCFALCVAQSHLHASVNDVQQRSLHDTHLPVSTDAVLFSCQYNALFSVQAQAGKAALMQYQDQEETVIKCVEHLTQVLDTMFRWTPFLLWSVLLVVCHDPELSSNLIQRFAGCWRQLHSFDGGACGGSDTKGSLHMAAPVSAFC